MVNIFGVEIPIMILATIIGTIIALIIAFKPQLLLSLKKGKYFDDEYEGKFIHFLGVEGVRYINAKIISKEPNAFGSWILKVKGGNGIFTLPRVVVNQQEDDCNLYRLSNDDFVCNIDAHGKPRKWLRRFDPHNTILENELRNQAKTEVFNDVFKNQEIKDRFDGYSTNQLSNQNKW
jgi:hypothetical protein